MTKVKALWPREYYEWADVRAAAVWGAASAAALLAFGRWLGVW